MSLFARETTIYLGKLADCWEGLGFCVLALEDDQGVSVAVDCSQRVWFQILGAFGENWRGQWVYWCWDQMGMLMGQFIPFDQAPRFIHERAEGLETWSVTLPQATPAEPPTA
ncbi:MAG TPA: hypothetical protein VGM19_00565 [Armatimonadota bacterium]|jgi:hypothetical protein